MSCFHHAVKSTPGTLLSLPAILALSTALFFTGCSGGSGSGSSTPPLLTPTLVFTSIPAQTYGNAPFTVSATSASSGAVAYSATSGPATISGSTVTLTGAGTVVLGASQAASGNYAAATASTSFTVSPETPTLTFQAISGQTYGNAPFTVIATSASSGPVTYSVTSGPATISGNTVTLAGVGTVNLAANQAATGNYTVATTYISFTVTPEVPTLSFQPISETYGNPPFTVSATSTSSGAVTYTVTSGPATISGSTVTLTGVGTVVLGASQIASGNYTATSTSTSFTVAPEVPSLLFAPIPVQTYGNTPFMVSATSASSGAVTYSVTSGPATVSGSKVTITGIGTVVLSASQATNGNYATATASTSFMVSQAGVEIGTAQSGSQPITGGHVYLYVAGTSGYATSAISLLNSSVLTNNPSNSGKDGNGNYYVTTDSSGNFSITNDYACSPGSVAYLYLVGGSYGGAANSAIGLLALLGSCPAGGSFVTTTPYVYMNEVSTIAAAYAMAGFATDATHVSSSGTALAKTGIQNAFATAANLDSISLGLALTTTPNGNGTVPQTEINTLANILAACINSAGPGSTECSTLFSNAKSAGSAGTTPTDTATAAIYMAHNPSANIAALYGIITGTPPFSPALTAQPNDFTIAINFTGGGLSACSSIAVDGYGNIWVANEYNGPSITELTSTGAIHPGSPFAGGGLVIPNYPTSIAIDASGNVWVGTLYSKVAEFTSAGTSISGSSGFNDGQSYSFGTGSWIAIGSSGNVWVTNTDPNSLSELTSGGSVISGSPYAAGGLSYPNGVAVDASGNIWVADSGNVSGTSGVSKLTSAGAAASGSPYTGGGLNWPSGIAIDSLGNAWVSNLGGPFSQSGSPTGSVSKLTNGGSLVSGTPFTGGGLSYPWSVAIDGSGNVWLPNYGNYANPGNSITELSSNGAATSGTLGFTGGSLTAPTGIAIDGSGNVWVSNFGTNTGNGPLAIGSVTEFVGAATPVVTPLVANLISPYSAPASKP
jgi:hypothetical protein